MRNAKDAMDHLLVGAPELEQGIAWLEARTGVRAIFGGSHPGLGTWNALASLGPNQYLEILAPDPAQPEVETFYVPGLRGFKEPRLATWAARADLGGDAFGGGPPTGLVVSERRSGSRIRLDGTKLAWTLAFPAHIHEATFGGLLPFLIEWEDLAHHPGRSAPPGLTVRSLGFAGPRPDDLGAALRSLGIEASIVSTSTPSLRLELDTPAGVVVLG